MRTSCGIVTCPLLVICIGITPTSKCNADIHNEQKNCVAAIWSEAAAFDAKQRRQYKLIPE
jgi:hypothetical protein